MGSRRISENKKSRGFRNRGTLVSHKRTRGSKKEKKKETKTYQSFEKTSPPLFHPTPFPLSLNYGLLPGNKNNKETQNIKANIIQGMGKTAPGEVVRRTQVPNKIRFGEGETFEEEDQFKNYCSGNSNSGKNNNR